MIRWCTCGIDHRGGRVGTHAAGIGAGVALADAFVILAGGHGQHVLAVDHDDKAGFFAVEKLLDHHPAAGVAKGVAGQHIGHGVLGLLQRLGHDNALARRQAVGLDHDGCALFAQVGQGRLELGEVAVGAGGNLVPRQEILGKGLGAFQLGGALARAEAAQAALLKVVDHAFDQRRFRADDGQAHVVCSAKSASAAKSMTSMATFSSPAPRGAGITGRHVDRVNVR